MRRVDGASKTYRAYGIGAPRQPVAGDRRFRGEHHTLRGVGKAYTCVLPIDPLRSHSTARLLLSYLQAFWNFSGAYALSRP
jgi:hypothetical protein